MSYNKKISREEFLHVLEKGPSKITPAGKADWVAIFAELEKTNEPLTIRQIYEQYVKGEVTYFRTKNVLQEAAAQGKCLEIWYDGRYWFYFGERPEEKPKRVSKKKK